MTCTTFCRSLSFLYHFYTRIHFCFVGCGVSVVVTVKLIHDAVGVLPTEKLNICMSNIMIIFLPTKIIFYASESLYRDGT